MSKEVTLRQCEWCDNKIKLQDIAWGDCVEEPGAYCLKCTLEGINERKKQAGDKTEFVLIEKPRDQRLGATIMSGYKKKWSNWFTEKEVEEIWGQLLATEKIGWESPREYIEAKFSVKRFWTIWEQDTPDIQAKIDKLTL